MTHFVEISLLDTIRARVFPQLAYTALLKISLCVVCDGHQCVSTEQPFMSLFLGAEKDKSTVVCDRP